MAITFSGRKLLTTPSNSVVLANQLRASVALKLKFNAQGDPARSALSFLVSRNYYATCWIGLAGAGTAPGTAKLQFAWRTATAQAIKNLDIVPGAAYHVAMTFDQGEQLAWLNGDSYPMGSLVGRTATSASPLRIGGWDYNPTAASIWTLDDVAIWNGYVLAAGDVVGLRDGTLSPPQVGVQALWRGEWTLDGVAGRTPVVGDPGLADAYGGAYSLTGISGDGAIVYAPSLQWVPAAVVREAHVGTGGRTIFAFFETADGGIATIPKVIKSAPSVSINGEAVGQATRPYCSGATSFVMWTLPDGVTVAPGDFVTIDAPVGWVGTTAGAAAAVSSLPVANMLGRSCFATESLRKTLRMGINIEHFPTGHNGFNWLPRNLARVMSAGSGVASRDATGKPLTLVNRLAEFQLYSSPAQYLANGIDATGYPGPTGLFAIGWDDLNPASPTTWRLASADNATTVVVERLDLRNPGVGGIGMVRVFDVQRADGSAVASTDIRVILEHDDNTPRFDRLKIFAPGDFSYVDDVPVVLSEPDPYAVSALMLGRFQGAGSLRMWYSLLGSISCFMSEPEHTTDLGEFCWGWRQSKESRQFGYTQISPYSRADTPYYYSQVTGERYEATLGEGVDAAATVWKIPDAAAAPVLRGQRLFAGDEVVRVESVSGDDVTVKRGMEGTTPAAHEAGPIEVGYRLASFDLGQGAFDSWLVAKFTTDVPHGLLTGTAVDFAGGWPTVAGTDGRQSRPSDYSASIMVTGANSFVAKLGPFGRPCVTLAGTTALDPQVHRSTVLIGNTPQIPYPMAAKLANDLGVPHLFIAIPHMATKDLILKIARQVRDAIDAGRTVWLEVSNETWNTSAGYVNQHLFFSYLSTSLYPGQARLAAYAKRTVEVLALFRQVFDEGGRNRGGQVKCFLNVQYDTLNGKPLLDWAAAQSPPVKIDGLSAAPYIDSLYPDHIEPKAAAAFADLEPDQALDLWIHSLYHRTDGEGVAANAARWKAAVSTYNSQVGHDCKFMSYEGGLELVYLPSAPNALRRNRDLFYHPNIFVIEQDFYAFAQKIGIEFFNLFCSASPWNGVNGYLWGLYHWQQQPYGRGDGSDGAADNRLCLATPGYANSKAPTVNQDLMNVSVRGLAWLAWNRTDVAPPPPGGGTYRKLLLCVLPRRPN
jgi:hypothetical protein